MDFALGGLPQKRRSATWPFGRHCALPPENAESKPFLSMGPAVNIYGADRRGGKRCVEALRMLVSAFNAQGGFPCDVRMDEPVSIEASSPKTRPCSSSTPARRSCSMRCGEVWTLRDSGCSGGVAWREKR